MTPSDPPADAFTDRVSLDAAKRQRLPDHAIAAVLEAQRLLGLTLGLEIAERRNEREPLQRAVADGKLYEVLLRAYQEVAAVLIEHVEKIHRAHRAHYTPEQRFRILRVRKLLAWTQQETARCFGVSPGTVARWEREIEAHPEQETVGSLVKATPPVRRFADVVRHLVQTMATSEFDGNKRIPQTLARAGWKVATETVRRIRKESPVKPPEHAVSTKPAGSVKGRYPNHVTMADLSEIPSLFRLFTFKLAVVFDVFSRFPLAFQLFRQEPSAPEMTSLFRKAVRRFGPPKHFVSDQGPHLTSRIFGDVLRRLGARHRFGAIGKVGSIALIERFWRTTKELLGLRSHPPLTEEEIERRVTVALFYYAYLRPHQALDGATPAEVYFGVAPPSRSAISPPRARPREGPPDCPVRIAFLDPERRLPVLIPNAA